MAGDTGAASYGCASQVFFRSCREQIAKSIAGFTIRMAGRYAIKTFYIDDKFSNLRHNMYQVSTFGADAKPVVQACDAGEVE